MANRTATRNRTLPNHHIPMGPSSSIQALMVAIAWTTAKVVHVTIKKTMVLTVERVSILRGIYTVLGTEKVEVAAGTLVCFTRSAHREGFYYLTVYNQMTGGWHCSCPRKVAGCHHIEDTIDYMIAREDAKQVRERERVLAERRRESEAELGRIMAETEAVIAAELAAPVQPKSEQARIADFPHGASVESAPVHGGASGSGHCNDIARLAHVQMDALAARAKRRQPVAAKQQQRQPQDETTARLMAAGLMR